MIKETGNARQKPCLRNTVHPVYARNSIGLSAVGKRVILVVLGIAACFAIACSSDDDKNVDAVNANPGVNGGADAINGSGATGGGDTSSIPTGAGAGGGGGATNVETTSGAGGPATTTGGIGGQGNPNTAGSPGMVDAGSLDGAAGNESAAAGNEGGTTGETVDASDAPKGLGLLPVDVIHGLDGTSGPYETAPEDLATGPGRRSGVFRPANLGANGEKHPVFVWSCGGGTNPSNYIEHMNHIASYGIVVVADAPPTPATGQAIIASMDWIIQQNETQGSPFYQKLATEKIGIGGHSMGSLNTLMAGGDPRVGTTVNVCGGSGGMQEQSSADYHSPALYLGEVNEGGTVNFEIDYEMTPTPVVFLIHESTNNNLNDHIMCARDNMAAWIAWMRWHLAGETQWKPDFFEGGIYCNSPWAECRSKNW